MAATKVIAVVGATGAQGGGLVRAILADPQGGFSVRALTRDPNSSAAKALAAAGADVVTADVDDPESLKRAFTGAYGAYCVTFFWAHFSPEKELAQAKGMADAAKAAGLTHVIWSTLEDTRRFIPLSDHRMPTLHGRYKVPHFDAKGEADKFFTDAGVPTTFLVASLYWDNFTQPSSAPKKGPDGTYLLTLPVGKEKLSGVASEDIGKTAYGIFKGGARYIGQHIGVGGEHLTGDEMAAAMSAALGKPVRYNEVPPATFRSFGFPGADDLGNMFQFYRDFAKDVNGLRDVARSRALNPALQDFKTWLAANARKIPLD